MKLTFQTFGPLAPYLLDLASAFEDRRLRLMLVGGFGLVLRRQWRQEEGARTLIQDVPPARATEDFDVLLTLEVLADPEQRQAIRELLTELGYQASSENFQFKKSGGGLSGGDVKVDFLAPIPQESDLLLRHTPPRVKAVTSTSANSLHGFGTAELLLVGEPLELALEGPGAVGQPLAGVVILPHPYTLMILKLHAFRDEYEKRGQKSGDRRPFAQKHLQDLYSLISLLTQSENMQLAKLQSEYQQSPPAQEAASIVSSLLNGPKTDGVLLLLETLVVDSEDLQTFLEVLAETFRKP